MNVLTTGTELNLMEEMKKSSKMNWEMAKALVEGKVSSKVLSWAEMVYETLKEIYKEER